MTFFDHAPVPGKKDAPTEPAMETPRRKLSFTEKDKSTEPKKSKTLALVKAKSSDMEGTPELEDPKPSLKRFRKKSADPLEKPEHEKNGSGKRKKGDDGIQERSKTEAVETKTSTKKPKKSNTEKGKDGKNNGDATNQDEEEQEAGKYSAASDGPKEIKNPVEDPKKKRKADAKEEESKKTRKASEKGTSQDSKKNVVPKAKAAKPVKGSDQQTGGSPPPPPPTNVPEILRQNTAEIPKTKEDTPKKSKKSAKEMQVYKAKKARFYRSLDSGTPRLKFHVEYSLPPASIN